MCAHSCTDIFVRILLPIYVCFYRYVCASTDICVLILVPGSGRSGSAYAAAEEAIRATHADVC
jgi:hypothetical protein